MKSGDIKAYAFLGDKALKTAPLNKLFSIQIKTSRFVKMKKFDIRMPEPGHEHGMLNQAKISKTKNGDFKIEGLRLHMPGNWQMQMSLLDKKGKVSSIKKDFIVGLN